jgi:hypothetical protein
LSCDEGETKSALVQMFVQALKRHSGIVLTDRVARDTHIGILAAVVSHDGAGGPVYALCATSDSPDQPLF